ncbi:MAG: hypothetical protein DRP79_01720 [Planctomycetota bacterium]|nr:MAG: hypothetical protein DRP79_01720 [Planctomycetota bacterium]
MNMMTSQPRYMPALNYIQRISLCDVMVYPDNVRYTPRDRENRNKIKTARSWAWLSVPVVHISRDQLIKDTRIDDEEFRAAGIDIRYHDYNRPEYPQLFGGFQPYMSAIDPLFNRGDDGFEIMSRGNTSREEISESSRSGSAS